MTTTADGIEAVAALAGTDLGATDWLTISQERVNTFADATDDHQWIHVDPQRAKDGPFKTTIAHGYLTLSLIIPLFGQLLDIRGIGMSVNYGLNRVRFPAPVPVGAQVRLIGKVASVAPVTGGVEAVLDFTVEAQGATKPVCVAQAIYRFYA